MSPGTHGPAVPRTTERPDPGRVRDRVAGSLGPEAVVLDGSGPPVAHPRSDEQVVDLLRLAAEGRWSITPMGAGLEQRGVPERGRRADLVVCTLAMGELVEYEPGDLVVRARAGLRLGRLQSALREEGQWLALDPPGGENVTLGGVFATGLAGPTRVKYGRPRDQLLGLTLVDGGGRTLALGGRVVKNVAGFDLVRLATGSRAELGVITETTVRVHPLPEEERTLVWHRSDAEDAWALGRELAVQPLPLDAAELLGGAWDHPLDGDAAAYRVVVRLGGRSSEVSAMRTRLTGFAGTPDRELEGAASRVAMESLAAGEATTPCALRVHALPERGRALAGRLAALAPERFALHLLHGTFRVGWSEEVDADALDALAGEVRVADGTLRVVRSSGPALDGLEVATTPSPAVRALHERIREAFDPAGVLPGAGRNP